MQQLLQTVAGATACQSNEHKPEALSAAVGAAHDIDSVVQVEPGDIERWQRVQQQQQQQEQELAGQQKTRQDGTR